MAEVVEFVNVQKAQGPQLNPSPPDVQFNSAYQRLYALARTYYEIYRKVSWVKSCVDIIADAATAETYVIRLVDQQQELDDQTENPRVKALQTILNNINPNYDAMELMQLNITAMKINGTSYNRILRKAGADQIVGLDYIAFTRVKPNVDDRGNVTSWSVKSKRGSSVETVPANDIAVFKVPHPDDDIIGLSPLESLDLPTAVDIHAQRFNEAAFRNGPYASMILSMEEADENEIERNRQYINTNFTKPENAHKPMLLEGGVKVIGDALQRRGVDGSFIELRKLTRQEICSVYRVPETKLLSEDNRSNTEQHDDGFIRDVIEPLQRLYWSQFNRRILQRELGITDMFIAPGKKQDVTIIAVNIAKGMVQAGASINEARKIMNLSASDGYDVPMVSSLVVEDDKDESTNMNGTPQKQTLKKLIPAPKQQNVQKATATANDTMKTNTSDDENEFMAAYLALMAQIRRRQRQALSLHDLHKAWLPTMTDVNALADSIYELYRQAWLTSYNRRRVETDGDVLSDLPPDVHQKLVDQAKQTAGEVFDTYRRELTDRMQFTIDGLNHLVPDKQFQEVESAVSDWLKQRATQKAQEIAGYEAGKAWNDGLFTHDRQYARDTEYTVLPAESSLDECVDIVAGAPYTLDTIPADLPLHPHCPHRYYAITR